MRDTASARAIARLPAVLALIAGLFLMHGLPAQACAAGTGKTGMTASAMTSHSGQSARVVTGAHGTGAVAIPSPAGHGTPCVFTPAPRGQGTGAALLFLAVTIAPVSPARSALGPGRHPRSHRAPPRTSTETLTALCVSRT